MTDNQSQSIRAVKPDIVTTIQSLRESAERGIPAANIFYGLSDLMSSQIERIKPVWNELDPEFRRKIVRRMAETSEANYEMDYRAFGLFALNDPDPEVRSAAIDVLWEDESLELLRHLVNTAQNDDTPFVRAAAMTALGRFILAGELGNLPESEAINAQDVAIRLLNDDKEEVDVRRRALEALSNSSHDMVPGAIKKAYRSGDRKMQVSSVFAMGRTCDEQWENIVLNELDSEDAEMRYEAARAAGEIELVSAVPKLAQLLTENDEDIRLAAVWSLGEIGGKEAIRILEAMLEVAEESEDDELIEAVEDAIGNANLVMGDMFSFDDED
jgi:HEAT repeat protein